VAKSLKDATMSECDGTTLFGGKAAFGKGTTAFKSIRLPPHYQVKVNVQLWK
jgi:hypothetical protein